ncbi:restriction endonuclease [Arenimonas sp.]|uniref:restriction endonuclease n=1 Tax=Arenimonas sp. TaxID=1872635 RepID=UPI0039E51768
MNAGSDHGMSRLSWRDFERLLAEHYRREGWQVEHIGHGHPGARPEVALDMRLQRDGRTVMVQCKHWNTHQVTHNAVHELIGLMATEGADGAVLVTAGDFTSHARDAAAKVPAIELLGGDELRRRLGAMLPDEQDVVPIRRIDIPGTLEGATIDGLEPKDDAPSSNRKALWLSLGAAALVLVALGVWYLHREMMSMLLPKPALQGAAIEEKKNEAAALPERIVKRPRQAARTGGETVPAEGPAASRGVIEIGSAEEMMSEEELREWKRKNAEAMKALEDDTPDLQALNGGRSCIGVNGARRAAVARDLMAIGNGRRTVLPFAGLA